MIRVTIRVFMEGRRFAPKHDNHKDRHERQKRKRTACDKAFTCRVGFFGKSFCHSIGEFGFEKRVIRVTIRVFMEGRRLLA